MDRRVSGSVYSREKEREGERTGKEVRERKGEKRDERIGRILCEDRRRRGIGRKGGTRKGKEGVPDGYRIEREKETSGISSWKREEERQTVSV